MYERNFKKKVEGVFEETLLVKDRKTVSNPGTGRSKVNDTCNYCNKKEHWVNFQRKLFLRAMP